MSSDLAISTKGLSKAYRIVHEKARSTTLAEAIAARLRNPRGRQEAETFWALRDVNLTVRRGEVVGIIGRNGAGKSTLLKVLSRITEPTQGEARVWGRIGSLLEVGTGFHPELTGRENIFLNGALLGMKRAEIARHFDAIVAFAEVDRFLDTPVKHFSSGMYVRLAFAVAAYLDSEILLVDEVLAVGDTAFQKRCLRKMGDVVREGRTVLFVSHNLGVVRSLCQRAIVVQNGALVVDASSDQALAAYIADVRQPSNEGRISFSRPRGAPYWMTAATLRSSRGGAGAVLVGMGESIGIDVAFAADVPIREPKIGFVIRSADGSTVINANNHYQETSTLPPYPTSRGTIRSDLGAIPLMPGVYLVSLWFGAGSRDTHVVADALSFEIEARDLWGTGHIPPAGVSPLWWPTSFHVLADEAEERNGT
jgi:lipopolysaccharide transport system ATP-binding protein